jgi:hypothetical protein
MSDYESETERRRRQRAREEYAEFQDPRNRAQRDLDYWWTTKLAKDAEQAYRRARPDERSRDGSGVLTDYSPIARYERETRGW